MEILSGGFGWSSRTVKPREEMPPCRKFKTTVIIEGRFTCSNIVLFFLVLSSHSRPKPPSECQSSSHDFCFNSCDVGRTSFSKWNHQRLHHFLWNKQGLPTRRTNNNREHNGTCPSWLAQVHYLLHQSQRQNIKNRKCFQNIECNNL